MTEIIKKIMKEMTRIQNYFAGLVVIIGIARKWDNTIKY